MTVGADGSNGYEERAEEFIAGRSRSLVGVPYVRDWARLLPPGAAILDLGCGSGIPISRALIADGYSVSGVDASASMTAAFRDHFPHAPVACEPVERSRFFDRTFDGVVSWDLMFLLSAETQPAVIRRVGAVLKPGGRFLFTSPEQVCTWTDILTGRRSMSLGSAAYEAALQEAGLTLIDTHRDVDENFYYSAIKADRGERSNRTGR
ncbi:class I SAM-dependent methyltransferase [Singulisphaera sp. PoT]|uniref:class I SAM-dependent methyltransferase n=1 Tax=Singulisphaera sp. PoT TaxID=3411797 RepID=UPI003BF4C325